MMTLRPVALVLACGVALSAQGRSVRPIQLEATDAACQSARLVSTGGPAPANRQTLAVRWTGYSNFELAYNGQVILLDAYFDRGSSYPSLGFKAADVRRADVILIGHGHSDHMSDAAQVAIATKAVVAGAPLTIEKLKTQRVPDDQLRTVMGRGGEVLQFKGFSVEPILARHGDPPSNVSSAFSAALQSTTSPTSAGQRAEQAAISARGVSDPRVATEGTIAYLITLDTGFRILYRDSGGRVTDFEKTVAARVGSVDLALTATSASYLTSLIVEQALEYVHTYKPRVFIPAHHDAPLNGLWRPTEPLFQAIKDESPDVLTISKGYREATCFKTER